MSAVEQERDFFLARALHGDHTWVGLSSDAMLDQALTGARWPTDYPHDKGDLGRCEETYRRAPEHLQRRMLPTLELFRRMLNPETGMVDGLWCFECDHGGHSSLWHGMCKEHAAAAGHGERIAHEIWIG